MLRARARLFFLNILIAPKRALSSSKESENFFYCWKWKLFSPPLGSPPLGRGVHMLLSHAARRALKCVERLFSENVQMKFASASRETFFFFFPALCASPPSEKCLSAPWELFKCKMLMCTLLRGKKVKGNRAGRRGRRNLFSCKVELESRESKASGKVFEVFVLREYSEEFCREGLSRLLRWWGFLGGKYWNAFGRKFDGSEVKVESV